MDRLAPTLAVARVYVDLVTGARLEIAHPERRDRVRTVEHRRAQFRGRRAAGTCLPVYLHREFLRLTTVETLRALHVQGVRRLVQKGATVRFVRVTWKR